MSAEARSKIRALTGIGMLAAIGLYLFVAANVALIPKNWTLPGIAFGGICYLAIVWPICRRLYASEFAQMRIRSPRKPRAPETFALVAIAAYVRTIPTWWSLSATVVVLLIAMIVFLAFDRIEQPLRAGWDQRLASLTKSKLGPSLSASRLYIQWVSVPFVLLVVVIPIEVLQNVPTAFPMVSTTIAWSLAFAALLLTIKTLLHLVPKGADPQ